MFIDSIKIVKEKGILHAYYKQSSTDSPLIEMTFAYSKTFMYEGFKFGIGRYLPSTTYSVVELSTLLKAVDFRDGNYEQIFIDLTKNLSRINLTLAEVVERGNRNNALNVSLCIKSLLMSSC